MILRFLIVLLVLPAATIGGTKTSQAATVGSATLTWTAPGDDSLTGKASLYDLRYSLEPINEDNFAFTPRVTVFRPAVAGTVEHYTVRGLLPGIDYYFAIRTLDGAGNYSKVSNLAFRSGRGIGPEEIVRQFDFSAPTPNPARGRTRFKLTMPHEGEATVDVFDAAGRRVARIAGGWRGAGVYDVGWDLLDGWGGPIHAGVYMVRAQLGDKVKVRNLLVVR